MANLLTHEQIKKLIIKHGLADINPTEELSEFHQSEFYQDYLIQVDRYSEIWSAYDDRLNEIRIRDPVVSLDHVLPWHEYEKYADEILLKGKKKAPLKFGEVTRRF